MLLTACGQDSSTSEDKQGGFASKISGAFGQTEGEKALHDAQSAKIQHLKEKQKELQKARTEAVLSTRAEGEPVTP